METRLALKYNGPAVEAGQMDVYEAAANMIAFSEFVVQAAKSTYGSDVRAEASVSGFGRGSFITELVFQVSGAVSSVFSVATPDQLKEVIKGAFLLWKHLKGTPPESIENNGNYSKVTNNSGNVIQINTQSLHLVFNEKGTEAVEQFIRKALEKPGMDRVDIIGSDGIIDEVLQSESANFISVSPTEQIADSVMRIGLTIEAPVFRDGLKWRFSDGLSSFQADIEDRDFLERVDHGERFGKGDVIFADVQFVQEQKAGRFTMKRTVIKVHEHRPASMQSPLV